MPEHSEQVSFHGVSEEKLRNFVTTYLAGHLRPAGKGKTQCLSFHFPKTHGEHKCRSGRFSRTYTGGSLTFNPKSGIVVFRTPRKERRTQFDIVKLWKSYQQNPCPLWKKVRENPSQFDKFKKDSGKYRGQRFMTVYKKESYVDWLLSPEGQLKSRSLGMRMLLEYCRARRGATKSTKIKSAVRQMSQITQKKQMQQTCRVTRQWSCVPA